MNDSRPILREHVRDASIALLLSLLQWSQMCLVQAKKLIVTLKGESGLTVRGVGLSVRTPTHVIATFATVEKKNAG